MALLEKNGVIGKICTKCCDWKPVEFFPKRKISRDGYQSQCKKCNNAPNINREIIQIDGKVCTKCHLWKAITEFYPKKYALDGRRSACIVCTTLVNTNKRASNREAERERLRSYYALNRDKILTRRNNRSLTTKQKIREYMIDWRSRHPEKVREYNRKRYALYPEAVQEANKRWDAKNPEKRRAIYQRRRARLQQAEGSFTAEEWERLKAEYNYQCLRCHRTPPEILLTPDHIMPLSKGGSNYISNIQPLCRSCNISKGTKIIDYRQLDQNS